MVPRIQDRSRHIDEPIGSTVLINERVVLVCRGQTDVFIGLVQTEHGSWRQIQRREVDPRGNGGIVRVRAQINRAKIHLSSVIECGEVETPGADALADITQQTNIGDGGVVDGRAGSKIGQGVAGDSISGERRGVKCVMVY